MISNKGLSDQEDRSEGRSPMMASGKFNGIRDHSNEASAKDYDP